MKDTKICSECKIEKSLDEFHNDKYGMFGKTSQCAICRMEYNREYKKTEEWKKKAREYAKSEKRKEYVREYAKQNREKINSYVRKYQINAKEKEKIILENKICPKCGIEKNIEEFMKDKYSVFGRTHQCKHCRAENSKIYRSKEENLAKIRESDNLRRKRNPEVRINTNISRGISRSIKKNFLSKWKYLSYNMEQLKEKLENQFDENMNWDNYGSYWHIDHIIPKVFFSFNSMEDEEFRRCWSLENLRPLEARENIKKGNKILEEFKELYDKLVVKKGVI